MLITNIFSGLLAAVMVALGASQIGNTNTQVGEELVVTEISAQISEANKNVSKVVSSPWHFTGGLGDLPTEAEYYQSGPAPNCPSGLDTVCELIAPDDGSGKPDMDAEIQVVGEGTQTISQRINDAIVNGPNETVPYLKSN